MTPVPAMEDKIKGSESWTARALLLEKIRRDSRERKTAAERARAFQWVRCRLPKKRPMVLLEGQVDYTILKGKGKKKGLYKRRKFILSECYLESSLYIYLKLYLLCLM